MKEEYFSDMFPNISKDENLKNKFREHLESALSDIEKIHKTKRNMSISLGVLIACAIVGAALLALGLVLPPVGMIGIGVGVIGTGASAIAGTKYAKQHKLDEKGIKGIFDRSFVDMVTKNVTSSMYIGQ